MKRIASLFILLFLAGWTSTSAQTYRFDHGPYLQELTNTGVTFVFTTSEKGISWVELKDDNGKITSHYDVKNGLRNAYTTFNTIRVEGLLPNTRYQYRMISKQIADFQPYKVTFGDSITSQWYEFSTWDPKTERCSFIALSDMHQDHDKLAQLLNLADVQSADIIFYVGDMMNYYDNEAVPFQSFIDTSVSLFATERPFVLVRGNHETRGNKAREYNRYVPKSDGKYYGAYRIGDVMFVIMDCGEDKPDDFWVYAGLTDFDGYRKEQAEWFSKIIQTKEYKTARWHVVMNHFPPISHLAEDHPERHGVQHMLDLFLPLYKRAKIDLMISGHNHRYEFMSPEEFEEIGFPVIINSTESVARVDIDGKTMEVKVEDKNGNTLKTLTVEK